MTSVTALSEVDIANMALSNLGIAIGIQSFNDKTAEAKACAFWYPKVRDQLLRSAPWNFAYGYQILASDGSQVPGTNFAYPGWGFAYQYPNDCLQAVAVTTQYGMRFGRYYWGCHWGYPYGQTWPGTPKIPFIIAQSTANAAQKIILTDLGSPAFLWYIREVTDTSMYDPLFSDGFAGLLGAKIGGTLKAAPDKIGQANQMAKAACGSALAQCMNEAQQDPARDSPSITCR